MQTWPYPTTTGPLRRGNAGARQTAQLTRLQARRAVGHPVVGQLARQLRDELAGVAGPHDHRLAAGAHAFVRDAIAFRDDPPDVELIRGPAHLMEERAGDCDDKAALLAAVLRRLGYRVRLMLTRSDVHAPGRYSHIYPEVMVRGRWTPADPTYPWLQYGVAGAPQLGPSFPLEV